MSMNQKYTWNDFLKDNPEYRQKKIKRTSKEAVKAFESAYKQHLKEFLKARLEKIEREKGRAEKKKKDLFTSLKTARNANKERGIKIRIGAMDAYLARLERMRDRTRTLQKSM